MKKAKTILVGLIVLIGVAISFFIYLPKSVDTALSRIKYPFEVGEILTKQQIEDNITIAIYTNKEKDSELQNAIVQKNGIFYSVVDQNGSLNIEKPKKLESGDLRTQVLISWYDKRDKYVVLAVAYDEDVAAITYGNQELVQLNVNGYRLFYGAGIGEDKGYEVFDKNGNTLEHIKE